MSLLVFLVTAAAGAMATLLVRSRPAAVRVVGAIALAACLLAALAVVPGVAIGIGESQLVATGFVRAWLISASGALLFVHLLGVATTWQRNAPLVMLAVLGTSAVALAIDDPAAAFLTIGAGAVVATLGVLLLPLTVPAVRVAADGLRVGALAAGLAVVGTGWADASGPAVGGGPLATALVLMAGALAVRLGIFPLHGPAARLTQTAPLIAAPILLGWVPAAFAAVALGWEQQRLAGIPESAAISLGIIVLAAATIALAGLAVAVQDDVAQVMGYAAIQDGGFILLALAAPGDASIELRGWLVLFALVRTAGFGFAAGIASAYETRLITDLGGWARRSPLLAVALVALMVATYGWPGLLPFDARAEVARPVFGALWPLVMLAAAAPLIALGRLLIAGVRPQGVVVRRGFGSRTAPVPYVKAPRVSTPLRRRDRVGVWRLRATWLAADIRDGFGFLRLAWRLNRAPAASALVLLLAGLPFALAVAGTDLAALAGDLRLRAPAIGALP